MGFCDLVFRHFFSVVESREWIILLLTMDADTIGVGVLSLAGLLEGFMTCK